MYQKTRGFPRVVLLRLRFVPDRCKDIPHHISHKTCEDNQSDGKLKGEWRNHIDGRNHVKFKDEIDQRLCDSKRNQECPA